MTGTVDVVEGQEASVQGRYRRGDGCGGGGGGDGGGEVVEL